MSLRPLAPLLTTTVLGLTAVLARFSSPPLPVLPAEGGLAYQVREAERGATIPCKLTLIGVEGTSDPRFTRDDIGRQEGDAVLAFNRIMSLSGSGVARVPLGTYDVYVSRGPEWERFVARRVKVTTRGAVVTAELRHVVDTHGWLSGDFHVHAALSSDSHVPMRDRVYEFVSDGVEMIVSTDHNVVSDYRPIIEGLGASRFLASSTGDELTTASWGHFGAFPLSRDLDRSGHGAVHVHGRNAADFFRDVRSSSPEAIINVHHPRIDNEIGYFNLGRFDPHTDRAERTGFSYDFDAIEVLNGYQDAERRSVDRVIEDWFALLDHGHIVTATGNSDTHHLDHNIGGYPRNYVRVLDDRPLELRPHEVTRAIKGHHLLLTTAPFVRLEVNGGTIGDLVPVKGGRAHARIEVQAAPWVSVTRVIVYVNGREAKRWSVPRLGNVIRFSQEYDVSVDRDSYLLVRVDGDQPLAPVVGDLKHFDVRPFALTNPVFLDANGNGRYDPPEPHGKH